MNGLTCASEQVFLEVELHVTVFFDNFEDLDCFCGDLVGMSEMAIFNGQAIEGCSLLARSDHLEQI